MVEQQVTLELMGVKTQLGRASECQLDYENTFPCTIKFESPDLGHHSFHAKDLFECLCELRRFLEARDWRILCNGARLDAYPSAMSRQMGGGARLYPLRMGEHPKRNEILKIFDKTQIDKVGTVDEQRAYYEKWVGSTSKNIRQRLSDESKKT